MRRFSIIVNNPIFRQLILVALFCLFVSGCESVPQLPSEANAKPIPENAITNTGRGDYEWSMNDLL